MTNAKLTEKDFKQLLEETDAYGDSLNWQALLVIEEITEVVFRKKRKVTGLSRPVLHRVFLGYDEGKHYLEKIHLGYSAFTLETLFEKYEIYENGTWKPFGVNCKSDNPVSNKTIRDTVRD